MGATLGGGFASLLATAGVAIPLSIPAFAMVGMGAMVGGGTGAVMTAVTMIFEMTRDYDIVMPLILAVATSVGVRRLLSTESIYTLKLVRRGRTLPKALHANMFLVRHAREVMDFERAGAACQDDARRIFAQSRDRSRISSRRRDRGGPAVRRHPPQRRPLARNRARRQLGDAGRRRQPRLHNRSARTRSRSTSSSACGASSAFMAIVVKGSGIPHGEDVVGVITKEHVADSVASSMKIYRELMGTSGDPTHLNSSDHFLSG